MNKDVSFRWFISGEPLVKRVENGLKNVFAAVSLAVEGKRESIKVILNTGIIQLSAPAGGFKPYEGVTPDDVISWAKAEMDKHPIETVAFYEKQVAEEIARKEAEAADLANPVPMGFYVPPAPDKPEA